MDIHMNARLTPHGRERLAKMIASGRRRLERRQDHRRSVPDPVDLLEMLILAIVVGAVPRSTLVLMIVVCTMIVLSY